MTMRRRSWSSLFALALLASSGCSSSSSPAQPGADTGAESGADVGADVGFEAGGACSVNADCAAQGDTFVCRKQACVNLVSALCPTLYTTKPATAKAWLDDSAVVFGSILPAASSPDGAFGKLLEDSISLALDDFGKVSGIPAASGGSRRPIVVVACNDGPSEDHADEAAKHLVDLGVPAIIGYPFSGTAVSVAHDVTIPAGVLLFSPSVTSQVITSLHATDKGLVWRTAPSDVLQARAMTLAYPAIEAAAKARYPMIGSGKIKVAIVNGNDNDATGIADALEAQLTFNGATAVSQTGSSYLHLSYGASTAPDLTKVPTIAAFAPDVVFLLGFNEAPDVIFTAVEKAWTTPADGHKPFWILPDAGEVASLWTSDLTADDQRQRVRGTVLGETATSWPNYGKFLASFASVHGADGSADTLGPAGAYDIVYLLAYASVMTKTNPLTGANLVKYGLTQLQTSPSSQMFAIGPSGIDPALTFLQSNASVNLAGVSGALRFDGKGDLTGGDVQIWCVPPASAGAGVAGPAIASGVYYDDASGSIKGCYAKACGLAGDPLACP